MHTALVTRWRARTDHFRFSGLIDLAKVVEACVEVLQTEKPADRLHTLAELERLLDEEDVIAQGEVYAALRLQDVLARYELCAGAAQGATHD